MFVSGNIFNIMTFPGVVLRKIITNLILKNKYLDSVKVTDIYIVRKRSGKLSFIDWVVSLIIKSKSDSDSKLKNQLSITDLALSILINFVGITIIDLIFYFSFLFFSKGIVSTPIALLLFFLVWVGLSIGCHAFPDGVDIKLWDILLKEKKAVRNFFYK